MNAVVLVIDRLNLGYLGCYGNAWVGTPGFDHLACESFVCDGATIDSPELASLYRSFWLGRHALGHVHGSAADLDAGSEPHAASLGHRLAAAGVQTTLVSDDAEVANHPLAVAFAQREEVPTISTKRVARKAEGTQAARFFSAALSALAEAKPPFCLWLHSQGMAGPWDAPREMRERYAAEDDPPPPDFVDPPRKMLPDDPDPDELLGLRQAYAAQVALVDECLEAFLAGLREHSCAAETLLVVLSARGVPLGLHGVVGGEERRSEEAKEGWHAQNMDVMGVAESRDDSHALRIRAQSVPPSRTLFSELTHVPWLLRIPSGIGASDRTSALVQPADLCTTLTDWFARGPQAAPPGGEGSSHPALGHSLLALAGGEVGSLRDRAVIVAASGERALRTAAWYARFAGEEVTELYAKPDDRWEVNDVARRCPAVADGMRQALRDFASADAKLPEGAAEGVAQLPPLSEELEQGWR